MDAWLWGVGAGLLWVAEALTATLILGFVGTAALLAMGAGFLGARLWLQLVIFVVSGLVLLVVVRPMARRQVRSLDDVGPLARMIGQGALVVDDIGTHAGQVRINGELWAARGAQPIATGDRAVITAIEGSTLVVEPEPPMHSQTREDTP